jgi:hypothetical protein
MDTDCDVDWSASGGDDPGLLRQFSALMVEERLYARPGIRIIQNR